MGKMYVIERGDHRGEKLTSALIFLEFSYDYKSVIKMSKMIEM